MTGSGTHPAADAHIPARALSPRRGTQVYPTSAQALPKANAHDTCAFTAASTHSSRQGLLKGMGITGAQAMLWLRALRANGDLNQYWDWHTAREHQRNHLSRYHDSLALAA